MTNSTAWHANDHITAVVASGTLSIAELGSFVDELVKSRVDIVGKLYLSYGLHSLSSTANGKSDDSLFADIQSPQQLIQ